MAAKRKFINTSFSLYGDLDIDSNSSGISSEGKEDSSDTDSLFGKKKRNSLSEEPADQKNDGVGRWTIASFYLKARFYCVSEEKKSFSYGFCFVPIKLLDTNFLKLP